MAFVHVQLLYLSLSCFKAATTTTTCCTLKFTSKVELELSIQWLNFATISATTISITTKVVSVFAKI